MFGWEEGTLHPTDTCIGMEEIFIKLKNKHCPRRGLDTPAKFSLSPRERKNKKDFWYDDVGGPCKPCLSDIPINELQTLFLFCTN